MAVRERAADDRLDAPGTGTSRDRPSIIDPAVASRIRLVGLDVDGVLTDGGIYLATLTERAWSSSASTSWMAGIKLMQLAGIDVVIITGRVSKRLPSVLASWASTTWSRSERAQAAGTATAPDGQGIDVSEVAFVGDDLPDLGVLRWSACRSSWRIAPMTSRVGVVRLTREGGRGAVREFAEPAARPRRMGRTGRAIREVPVRGFPA
jgi:3-deoxy-D-manno-octulosonate 8-phosphate phosphatase (KDO 8-P phosphatase)